MKTWLMGIKNRTTEQKHMQKEMIASEIVSDIELAVTITVFIVLYHVVKRTDLSDAALLIAFAASGTVCFCAAALTAMIFYKYDMLTGLLKKDGFRNNTLDVFILRRQKDYSVLFLNISNFSMINQRHSYETGDQALKLYAAYLKKLVGRREFAAKYDNDNFVLLVKKSREQEVIDALAAVEITLPSGEKLNLGCFIGIYRLESGDSFMDMERCGQLALSVAREDASADIVWFDQQMAEREAREKALLDAFRPAMENREFMVYYQPKADLKTRTVCGAEALVRWSKDGRIISPGEFVPVFEKHGRITELDMYVFRQVCADISRWCEKGITPVRISSNFSRLHLKNRHFTDDVADIIRKSGISAEYIEAELTESSGYSDLDLMKKLVRTLEQQGVHTSIDDFGTGYSSLSMLKELNVDVVKLDKTFADALTGGDEKDKVFILDIISMVHKLGMTVLCEGVETQEQIDILSGTDCSIIQGYYFDKPLARDDFENRLINRAYDK